MLSRELKISTLLKQSNVCKNSRSRNGDGGKKRTAFEIFQFLLMLVFEGTNLFRFLGSKKQDIACAKSTYYRFLSNCHYNWRRFVLLLSGRAAAYFSTLTRPERVKCFVLDDSVIPHGRPSGCDTVNAECLGILTFWKRKNNKTQADVPVQRLGGRNVTSYLNCYDNRHILHSLRKISPYQLTGKFICCI